MEDVARIAKNFAAQQGTQSFGFVRKDTPAAPLTFSRTALFLAIIPSLESLRNLDLRKKGNCFATAFAQAYAP
jgi:hypothetical protein